MIKLLKRKLAGSRSKNVCKGGVIYGSADFFNLIEFERSRSQHVQKPFSVIFIDIDQQNYCMSDIEQLLNNISKRIRKMDQLGWYDNNRIGILLPNTDKDGANVIIEDLSKKIDKKRLQIQFDTFSYPA